MSVIRPATPADAAELGRLGAMLVEAHHDFDPLRFIAPTPRTREGYGGFLKSQIGADDVVLYVADEGDAVAGYVYGALEGHDWMMLRGPAGAIHDLIVDPAHRGKGIGAMLLDEALAALTRMGAPRVVLSTAVQNEAAQRLFTRAGFRPTMIEMTREA